MSETNLLRLMESALQEEYSKYEQVLNLSLHQIELLEEDDPDTDLVADLMNRKMNLIEAVQGIEFQHASLKEQWQSEYEQYSLEERSEISQLRAASMQLFERLYQVEQDIFQAIKKCETKINQKLKILQVGRNVNQAYFANQRMPSRYIDKKK